MAKITVLMSVYNGERYIRKAIESILRQTYTDFEFLIINDGSIDKSRDIILSFNDYRIRLVDNSSNIGLTKSLNRGLKLSSSEYIARQDADDISYPDRLKQQIQFLHDHPDVALLGTRARATDKKGKPCKINLLRIPVGLHAIRWYLMFQNAFIHSSVMFRRNIVWEKLGGYDESFLRAQDYELWSRIARSYEVENLKNVLIDHRFEYGSLVSNLPLSATAEEDVVLDNLKVFLNNSKAPIQWALFINCLRHKSPFPNCTDWKGVFEILKQIYNRYCDLHPHAKSNKSIRSHLSTNLYWLAYFAAPCNRKISLKTYLYAKRIAKKSLRNPSLIKYIALWTMGENIRRLYRYINQHTFANEIGHNQSSINKKKEVAKIS